MTDNKKNEKQPLTPSHYIGIGASAGGLEAIDAFFKHMPPNSGCAFIVVQHLSPDRKSLMAELLSKRTEMPVCRAEEGMQVEANHVYLIPPNHNLRIFHGKLLLTEQDRQGGINLPIDIFLTSLAQDQGDKAVAIILSGTGSDGTRGVRAIKEKVGMVMAQDEESAAFDGMPRSTMATGLVDYILPPEEMPQQLISYIHHPYVKKTEHADTLLTDEDGISRIFSILREKTGVDFTYYKPSTMVRRIERRMSVNQILSLPDYVRYLERHSGEVDTLRRDLLIGVTSFFRDPQVFAQLKEKWLPALISKPGSNNIRIWVSGCSTGEEAYTLAILCQEVMSSQGTLADVKIFATDVDRDAIATAGAGMYPESISADVPPEYLSKYFHRRENGFLIARHIREMVVFAQHNVIKDPPFTNIELVSCRNMLIYLQPVLQRRVMELFNFSLNPNGILLLGTSETTGEMSDYFDPLHHKWKIYRSRGRRHRDALSEQASSFDPGHRALKTTPHHPGAGYRLNLHEEERVLERLLQGITMRYIPFTMVVNDRLELLRMAGDATGYLHFPSGKMHTQITKLVHRDLSIPLSTGIQKALKQEDPVDYSNIRLRDDKNNNKVVDMHIVQLPQTKAQDPLLAIFIEEKRTQSTATSDLSNQSYDAGKEAEQRISDLEQELQFTRENLQATVEELETSNEELQATNEELLASNEELQSTNEELQSVNEELYTVNAEHQSKISELTEVNNDLDNLLTNIRIASLFLDHNLEIRRFTPEVAHFLRIIPQDVGRPFDHLMHDLADVNLSQIVQAVNKQHKTIEQEVQDRSGNVYLMRVFPYRISTDFYSGVLLTFININTLKRIKDALLRSEEANILAQEAAHLSIWDWDIATNEMTWSPTAETIFGLRPDQLENTFEGFLGWVHKDDRTKVEQSVQNCLDNPDKVYQIMHRVVRTDGSVRWVKGHGKIHVDDDKKPCRMIGIIHDATEEHQAKEALSRSEQCFRATLEHLNMLALQLDREGKVIFANDYLIDFTGWSREKIIGKNWIEQYIPAHKQAEARVVFDTFIRDEETIQPHSQSPILCSDDNTKMVQWNNTAIRDDSGVTIGIFSLGQPITN